MASGTLERCFLHGWIHCTGQMADSVYGVVWVRGLLMSTLWIEWPMVAVMGWTCVCYGQGTQVHFIDGILNAQRYRDEILRPIVVPFIHDHHLMLQHDNAWPHVARICTQLLEAENIPVLAWPAYSPDMSPIEHVWDALDRRIRQRVPVPVSINLIICCFLLKLCHFYFLFSETTLLSLTKWMEIKCGGHVLEQHLGFSDGYALFGCLSFPPIMFLLPKVSLWG